MKQFDFNLMTAIKGAAGAPQSEQIVVTRLSTQANTAAIHMQQLKIFSLIAFKFNFLMLPDTLSLFFFFSPCRARRLHFSPQEGARVSAKR